MNKNGDSEKTGRLSATIKSKFLTSHSELSNIEGNLLSAASGQESVTVLITSAVEQEGKSIAAISMAYALATFADARVLLIDGDLYSSSLSSLFHIEQSPGLSDLILGHEKSDLYHSLSSLFHIKQSPEDSDLMPAEEISPSHIPPNIPKESDLYHLTEFDNLFLLPGGSPVKNNIDVFKEDSFQHKLNHFKEQFDFVIFDGPPFLGSSSVSQIAHYFDGLILVVQCESTNWEVVKLVKNKITQVGGNIFGAVLNRREYYIPKILYKGW